MPKGTTVRVRMLDDTINQYEIKPTSYGNVLLQAVMKDLDILESDYFGSSFDNGDGLTYLDPLRQLGKQIKNFDEVLLEFGVKFFSPDPSQMQDEYTRYLFALQVKRDINTGILPCAETTAIEIASNIVQAEFGDWNATECADTSYLKDMKLFPNPTEEQLQKISESHRNMIGKKPADADYSLLDIARRLELYGVRLFPALDAQSAEIALGVSHAGVLVFQGTKRINNFNWARIRKLSFKRKRFLIKLRVSDTENQRRSYGDILIFVMKSRDACKNFWRICIEHHSFFRLEVRPTVKPKPLILSRGSSFHYNGKTQKELLELVRNSNFRRTNFIRTTSRRRLQNSVSGTNTDNDAKKAKPDLPLQDLSINQSHNANTPSDSVTSPSMSSTVTEDQGSYRVDDSSRSMNTDSNVTTADISPDSSQRSQMPEWQLESKSLHSSATPISEAVKHEQNEAKGNSDIANVENYAQSIGNHVTSVSDRLDTNSETSSSLKNVSLYGQKMRHAFGNSRKGDSGVETVETLLQNVTAADRHSIISNTSTSPAHAAGGKSLSFNPLSPSFIDEFIPPLPPKERQISSEDGNYDNLLNNNKDKLSGEYVSSSGFTGIGGNSQKDPFVNDSVVNLAEISNVMTPEVKVKLGEQKIKTGHYSVPKKPPAPPEGETFNSPRWNRTSQILDKEMNEAMTELYKAIDEGAGYGDKQESQVCIDGSLPIVISSSDEEVDTKPSTPVSPEDDPLLAPIKMEFDDMEALFTAPMH